MENRRLTTQLQQPSDYVLTMMTPKSRAQSLVGREHEVDETKVLNELLLLDEAYRNYFKEYLRELGLQRMAAEKLWPLTRTPLSQSDKCQAPQSHLVDAEDLTINKYQLHYQIILGSNIAMDRGLAGIRSNLLAFRREYGNLDLTEETPFIMGDAFHKPIKFFYDLAGELFNYFYSHYLKLECGSYLLDPVDMTNLENYQKMLAPSEEFEEYFIHNLSYCQCLRAKPVCPETVTFQPSKPSEIQDAKKRALLRRCQYRINKITLKNHEENMESIRVPAANPSTANTLDLEHELRMNRLTWRLAHLREGTNRGVGYERNLVQQMIYALSPSLLPTPHQFPNVLE